MENVIIIKVESLTDLEPSQNFFVLNTSSGELFRGDDTSAPVKIMDEKKPVNYSRVYLYE